MISIQNGIQESFGTQNMNYRRLGRTDLMVSVIGMGTCQLRLVPERQAIETLIRGFRLGVNIVHTSHDYEGADKLVAKAINESGVENKIYVCSQGWGEIEYFKKLFESTCEIFGTKRLDLYGINSIYDLEMHGDNIWGRGGSVEYLLRKKEEGRLGAIYCTTHGPIHHLKKILERDVFDAIMIAYNILGFHVITYCAKTLNKVVHPTHLALAENCEFEDIPSVGYELFPLLQKHDVGLMVMKPLAGGLLCEGKAFQRYSGFTSIQTQVNAADVLRFTLMNSQISCLFPGTASVEEADENAMAGWNNIALSNGKVKQLESHMRKLSSNICSRCGDCDYTCSQNLPISWLFRAAYINLSPATVFENDDHLQYFFLLRDQKCPCLNCTDVTCSCPKDINIRENMIFLHKKMVDLHQKGVIIVDNNVFERSFSRKYDYRLITKDIPEITPPREEMVARIYIQNTGWHTWYAESGKGHSLVSLAVYEDGSMVQTVRLRKDVAPGEKIHFTFDMTPRKEDGYFILKQDIFEHEVTFFSEQGLPVIVSRVKVDKGLSIKKAPT